MLNIEDCSIEELVDTLQHLKVWQRISYKLDDVTTNIEYMNNYIKPTTKILRHIQNIMDNLRIGCDEIEKYMTNDLEKFGIDIDDINDTIENTIMLILKKKLCSLLRVQMILNEHAYSNMEFYVDEYFQYFSVNHCNIETQKIEEWILSVQKK